MTFSKDTHLSQTSAYKGVYYFLIGSGIGAAAALLLAPKSGCELRGDISKAARKGYDETKDLTNRLKERSDDLYHSLKEKADEAYEFASTKLSLTPPKPGYTFETADYVKNGEIRENPRRSAGKPGGRKPSSIL